MKTAETILKEQLKGIHFNNPDWTHSKVIEAMKEYALQACEQQRNICYRAYMDQPIAQGKTKFEAISKEMEAIRTAPSPNLL